MILNTQPAEKLDFREDGSLDVHSIYFTMQGEGPFVGEPAVFVRLAGCSLCCRGCDTEYTSTRRRIGYMTLINEIGAVLPGCYDGSLKDRLVVFTGGEPLRQNLVSISRMLSNDAGAMVQVETNGVHEIPGELKGTVVCSPKTPFIHSTVDLRALAFKYILDAEHVDTSDGLPTTTLSTYKPARPKKGYRGVIYVQPMDEKDPERNKANIQAALDSCMRHGYRLSLQTHKLLGLQ